MLTGSVLTPMKPLAQPDTLRRSWLARGQMLMELRASQKENFSSARSNARGSAAARHRSYRRAAGCSRLLDRLLESENQVISRSSPNRPIFLMRPAGS